MTLHTVGPADMAEDERRIASAYRSWATGLLVALPSVVAGLADLKWVVATGFFMVGVILYECGGRLHDICIRLRRTNLLLVERAVKSELRT